MFRNIGTRWFVIGVILLLVGYWIYPTVKYYTMSTSEIEEMNLNSPMKLQDLRSKIVNLGLDLQGGMHVILEADIPALARNIASKKDERLENLINEARDASLENSSEFFDEFEKMADRDNIHLIKYYFNLDELEGKDNADVMKAMRAQGDVAVVSVLEIVRNRIDEFGVSEPVIQRQGAHRIIVELAGVQDPERARSLIQRTALLEFTLVKDATEFQNVLESIDSALLDDPDAVVAAEEDATAMESESEEDNTDDNSDDVAEADANADTSNVSDDIFASADSAADAGADPMDLLTTTDEMLAEKPFSGYLRSFPAGTGVLYDDYNRFNALLKRDNVQNLIPKDASFRWGNRFLTAQLQEGQEIRYRPLYLCTTEAILTGGVVVDAKAALGSVGSNEAGKPTVTLSMSADGGKTWSRFTGANVDRRVAIVLDKKVYMAPRIINRIPANSKTLITGLEDLDEAKDIANVLRAGKLPAPVNIVEERTVGPSLGHDSIIAGRNAIFIGLGLIVLFILFYYKGAGVLATLALSLNLIFVIAVLSTMGATLTLPGIAGLILTIGMAIDANVIVFERIREELDRGKTVRSSIESGYNRAFVAILDANLTTLIAAFVLASMGSGPIRGFAYTLGWGIVSSMFTAVFFTRTVMLIFVNKSKPIEKLSI